MLSYLNYAVGGWLSPFVPRRLGLAITWCIALGFRWTHPRGVHIVEQNLRGIEEGRGRPFDPLMVPEVFHHFARSVYEFISLPHQSTQQILKRFSIVRGEEYLHRPRKEGEGLLIVSAHLAGWELGGAWLATQIGSFHTVAMEHPSPRVAAYFTERRQRRGILVHPLGASYRALHNALSEGEAVALLADRGFGGGGSRVEFFGRLAVFPTGYLHLAAETGARILPMFARRVGSITEIRIEEPFKVERGEEDTGLAHMVELLELHIGAAPEQWARFTPVWNTRAGSPRVRRSEGE